LHFDLHEAFVFAKPIEGVPDFAELIEGTWRI
jgi:hypothetical protein